MPETVPETVPENVQPARGRGGATAEPPRAGAARRSAQRVEVGGAEGDADAEPVNDGGVLRAQRLRRRLDGRELDQCHLAVRARGAGGRCARGRDELEARDRAMLDEERAHVVLGEVRRHVRDGEEARGRDGGDRARQRGAVAVQRRGGEVTEQQ